MDELEEFEKRVKAKREAKLKQQQLQQENITTTDPQTSPTIQNTNDISETKSDEAGVVVDGEVDELDEYLKNLKLKEQEQQQQNSSAADAAAETTRSAANFVLILYWFLAILNLASATFSNRKHYSKCLLTVLN